MTSRSRKSISTEVIVLLYIAIILTIAIVATVIQPGGPF